MMSYFSRAKSSAVIPSSGNENAPSITAQDEETVIYQPRCGPADKAKSTDGEERTHHRASSSKSDSAANRSVDEERQKKPTYHHGRSLNGHEMTKESQQDQDYNRQLQELNRQNMEKLKSAEERSVRLERLLEQRTSELQEAQTFLNKLDEYPGSTVLQRVEEINSEMFNLATHFVDIYEQGHKLDLWERNREDLQVFFERCSQIARGALGEPLYGFNCQIEGAMAIRDPILPDSLVILQVALQSILVSWTTQIFGKAGALPGAHDELGGVYNLIRSSEEQSVSAQWRAIAYRATRHLRSSSAASAVEMILSVLFICGLSTRNHSDVADKIAKRIRDFEGMLFALLDAIRGGITSCDLELVTASPGAIYNPQTMVDPYSSASPASDGQGVLCTVGFGLQRITMRRADGNIFQPEIELLKPPDVVLVSLLDDFKQPTDLDFANAISDESDPR